MVRSCFVQRSFDDLGTPLCDVTFCVLDIETTGSDRNGDGITEIGAVKVRAGECLGTFHTMVNPGRAIPPTITVLTGITDMMVAPAPRIEQVLPSLLEFARGCVIVGHNVNFDTAFLNAAMRRSDRPRLDHPIVDTLPLARRLVRDEVPDCRLGTLATRFRLDHKPTHRALDDALATADLLHLLIERAAGHGVLGLDDLIALPKLGSHPMVGKLKLTTSLPRSPGVYLFHGLGDEILYVGKATNLRQRVRSYFGSDDRRKIGALLRETQRISCVATPDVLSAEVLELRYIHHASPRYNKVGTTSDRYCYVRLSTHEAWPRFSVVRDPTGLGAHLGPLPSKAMATLVIEALQTVFPLRRCTIKLGRNHVPTGVAAPCTPAQLGVSTCPCAQSVDPHRYAAISAGAVSAITTSPHLVLDVLRTRLVALAAEQRFEEAAAVRDRAHAFVSAMQRQRMIQRMCAMGATEVAVGDVVLHLDRGVLQHVGEPDRLPFTLPLPAPSTGEVDGPLPRHAVDEVLCLARGLDRLAGQARVQHCDGVWTSPAGRLSPLTRLHAA